MGSESEFRHIKIGLSPDPIVPDDDEEIVIVAGTPSDSVSGIEEPENAHGGSPESEGFLEGAAGASEPTTTDMEVPDAEDLYRATTIDDIKSSKMPKTQIAVIAVALVCLAAFIIWYIFF